MTAHPTAAPGPQTIRRQTTAEVVVSTRRTASRRTR